MAKRKIKDRGTHIELKSTTQKTKNSYTYTTKKTKNSYTYITQKAKNNYTYTTQKSLLNVNYIKRSCYSHLHDHIILLRREVYVLKFGILFTLPK
jgi:glycine cleavage system protein P-like pyridoxal-binding family